MSKKNRAPGPRGFEQPSEEKPLEHPTPALAEEVADFVAEAVGVEVAMDLPPHIEQPANGLPAPFKRKAWGVPHLEEQHLPLEKRAEIVAARRDERIKNSIKAGGMGDVADAIAKDYLGDDD